MWLEYICLEAFPRQLFATMSIMIENIKAPNDLN